MSTPWQQFQSKYENQKVLVFGLGRQGGGVGVANIFAKAGSQVRVTDALSAQQLSQSLQKLQPEIETTLGKHTSADIEWADHIIKNPAVPYNHPLIQKALQQGKPVVGETALALKFLRDQTIGITGTRGKTTTTTLIHHLLVTAGHEAIIAGNIPGKPLLASLNEIAPQTWVVTEISSFQLESLPYLKVSPHISVLTTIYPDHLDRYPDQEDYQQTKLEILKFQKPEDIAVYQADREWSSQVVKAIQPGVKTRKVAANDIKILQTDYSISIKGQHNLENIALALQAVHGLVNESDIKKALQSFSGVNYRLQNIGQVDGINYINDTTSTTPTSLEKALDTYAQEKFVLILGGATKKLPLPPQLLKKIASLPQAAVIMEGSGAKELEAAFKAQELTWPTIERTQDITTTVETAHQLALQTSSNFVVFSPGFASFEWFNNEFDRGEQFNQLVQKLGS